MNRSSGILSRYGALELKRAYRKNLSIGIFVAVMLSMIAMGAMFVAGCGRANPTSANDYPIDISTIKPPTRVDIGPKVREYIGPQRTDYSSGPVVPVKDEDMQGVEADIPTMDQIKDMLASQVVKDISQIGNEPVYINNLDLPDENPDPEVFIPYEEAPIIIENVQPEYPQMARRAGLTGEVWVNVLVGKDGSVKDVRILKCTNEGVGFEEAAVAAAYNNSWKPAISNGQPLAVWTAYKIVFKLQ